LAFLVIGVAAPSTSLAQAMPDPPIDDAPDLRETESPGVINVKERNFVIVPIPLSNPTLGTGLVLGGAYFYRQTPGQKKTQPASSTGAAGMYTNNDSYAVGIGQQSYWGGDKWRLSAVTGYADIKLDLARPEQTGIEVNWDVRGVFLQATLLRRIRGDWYGGINGRYFDNEQIFSTSINGEGFKYDVQLQTAGLGLNLEHDTRDMPTNPYAGHKFEFKTLFNNEVLGSDNDYETYLGKYVSYHGVAKNLVLAWEARGCYQSGEPALWDACKVYLRGFPIQEYLSTKSASAQVEGRWRAWKSIGFVAFLGGGLSDDSYSPFREDNLISSYGVGFRWMVLKSQRINLRIDYARSDNQDAWYLAIGEAF
jgi:hypothetical protein